MIKKSRAFTILTFLFLFLFLAAATSGQTRRRFRQTPAPAPNFECRTFCSPDKLRTPVMELVWRASQASLAAERVEVTVYKDGFAKGVYVSVGASQGQSAALTTRNTAQDDRLPPALKKLVVVDSASLSTRPGMATIQIEGLEPGLNYFWRVVSGSNRLVAGGAVRCKAPVCPADMQPGQKP
ncbi:MAG TPA: hypothetical protein VN643_15640 [Pyrinomonadaceae bacterium]|nr:hypothetical protein [Pyrinomonadaceae bacterium]